MATSVEMPTPEQLEALLDGPATTPPAGIIPRLDNPPNIDTICYLTFSLCVSFASLAVIIRIYTKHFLIRSIAYEDYACFVGLIGLWGLFIPSVFAQRSGAGTHAWDLRLSAFSRTIYWFDTAVIVYVADVFFIKLSILLQYLRIFVPDRKGNFTMFLAIQACIWIIFSFSLIYLFLNIFECNPREKLWEPWINTGHCFNSNTDSESSGIFNIISDFAVLILPMPCLWKLQMAMRKKILMTGVFATGFIVCVTSILRTYYSFQVSKSSDKSYNLELMGLWSWAELTIGIIVGCLPVIPKFFQHAGPRVFKILSFRSNYEIGPAHALKTRDEAPKTNRFTIIQRPFTTYVRSSISESLTDPYSPQARLHGEYLTPDNFVSSLPNATIADESTQTSGVAIATRRDDLEYGQK